MDDTIKEKLLKQVELLQQRSTGNVSTEELIELTKVMVSLVTLAVGNQSSGAALSYHPSLAVLSVEDLTDLYAGRALRWRRSQGEARRTEWCPNPCKRGWRNVVKETNMYPLITKEEYEQLMKQIKEETLLAKNNLFLVRVNLAIQMALLVIWSYTLWRLLQQ